MDYVTLGRLLMARRMPPPVYASESLNSLLKGSLLKGGSHGPTVGVSRLTGATSAAMPDEIEPFTLAASAPAIVAEPFTRF